MLPANFGYLERKLLQPRNDRIVGETYRIQPPPQQGAEEKTDDAPTYSLREHWSRF